MEINENYDPFLHMKSVSKMLNEKVGEGVNPSLEKVLTEWDKKCAVATPRTFMYIMDMKANKAIRSHGFKCLGYPDNWKFDAVEFTQLFHVNQFKLIAYQTLSLYKIFLNYPKLIKGTGAVYSTSRGVKHADGTYKHVHQLAYPLQYDSNGYLVKYLSCYRILGDYQGEALDTGIYTNPKYEDVQRKLNMLMEGIKANMLDALGFDTDLEEVIKLMALGESNKDIANRLKVSIRSLERYRSRIIHQANRVFPLNKFKTAKDVVEYLKAQRIVGDLSYRSS